MDKPQIDLYWNIIFTVIFGLSLIIGSSWQSIGVATAVLIVHILFLPVFTIRATQYVFRRELVA